MMNGKKSQKAGMKTRIKAFSDGMFRNYQIMRKRWEISSAEKKRSAEISRLGMSVFRLYGKKELTPEAIEPQIKKIGQIDLHIKALEERLRDIIMNADVPRQIDAGKTIKKPTPEKVEMKKSAENTDSQKPPAKSNPVKSNPVKSNPVKSYEKKPVESKTVKKGTPKAVKKPSTGKAPATKQKTTSTQTVKKESVKEVKKSDKKETNKPDEKALVKKKDDK